MVRLLPGLNSFFLNRLQKTQEIDAVFLNYLPCPSENFSYITYVSLSGGSGDWATPK